MTDERVKRLIQAQTRMAEASRMAGEVYRSLFQSSEGHDKLELSDEWFQSLERRIFNCFLEAGKIASAFGDIADTIEEPIHD